MAKQTRAPSDNPTTNGATARAAANLAVSRVVALLRFWALVVGVCVLLLWQVVKCIYKHYV